MATINAEVHIRPSFKANIFERIGIRLFGFVTAYIAEWWRLPALIGALYLYCLRVELYQFNLYDGYGDSSPTNHDFAHDPLSHQIHDDRDADRPVRARPGPPKAGCAFARFGRNFPRPYCHKPTEDRLWTPDPIEVSNQFLRRREKGFQPAKSINLLAAAWIQFQVHDWMMHPFSEAAIPMGKTKNKTWARHFGGHMYQTQADEVRDPTDIKTPGYVNTQTPLWDLSQIYGCTKKVTRSLRDHKDTSNGRLKLEEAANGQHYLPHNPDGSPKTGFNNNWWTGIEMLHTLFALEHNYICDMLRDHYPQMSSGDIFDKARLINCALSAKIHTTEWTPALLAHPALELGMSATWWGMAGEFVTKHFGRFFSGEIISGVPGSGLNYFGVPFSITEEFVTVYRMHSLLPDSIAFYKARTGAPATIINIDDLVFDGSLNPVREHGLTWSDAFYSFGHNNPGAITLNNYCDFIMDRLRTPATADEAPTESSMGFLDIYRDRERGVPRYTVFRKLLRMSVPKTFEELACGDQELADRLRTVYNNRLDDVDTIIGCHCERPPPGFAFSETAYRIFLIMATRRLQCDPYLASNFNEATYTPVGFHHIQFTTLRNVLKRHFPDLEGSVPEKGNVFAPWRKTVD